MEKERLAYLFQKYVDKDCSFEEKQEFVDMLSKAEHSDDLQAALADFWNKSHEVELGKGRANQIFNHIVSTVPIEKQDRPKFAFKLWFGWAAAILVVGVASLWIIREPEKDFKVAKNQLDAPVLTTKLIENVVVKTLNEHQKVTLPDGSTVILNNNSSISYPVNFSNNKREVLLNGEGYFDIKHDDKKPFTVFTGKIRTTVLGTAFNVKAYNQQKNIEVTVTRGKVSVADEKTVLGILVPNQQIVLNKVQEKSNQAIVVAKNIVQWQESDLFFDDISMEQATAILSKRFNNTIINFKNDQVKKCRFTATFLKGESLDEILKIICSYNNAQYQSSAGVITITGVGCE